jgi:hypothetical protein
MLTRLAVVDRLTVDEHGSITVRRADRIVEDGAIVAQAFHQHVVAPGDDVRGQDPRVRAVAAALWTPDVIAARRARLAALAEG